MAGFSGKVAIVTGGASGIGRATCRLFAEAGATVLLGDIDAQRGQKAADEIVAATGRASCLHHPLDVTRLDSWQALIDLAVDRLGMPDILVNSAGICLDGDFLDYSLADWEKTFAVNSTGTFLGCQAAIRAMAPGGWMASGKTGAIVNVGSIYSVIGADDAVAYAASKGSVRTLTKAVALYCAGRGLPIRCNAINPTFVDTEMLQPFAASVGGHAAMLDRLSRFVPMGRLAAAAEIARAILFLSNDDAAMVTGTELMVDGGTTAGHVTEPLPSTTDASH